MADGFTVTAVNQSQQLDQTGHLVDTVTVTYELDNGAGSGTVSVPLTDDWATVAEAKVREQAAAMVNLLNI